MLATKDKWGQPHWAQKTSDSVKGDGHRQPHWHPCIANPMQNTKRWEILRNANQR